MILSEAVYAYSTTMDGRHFAEEFVRRKKQADRGVFDKDFAAASGGDSKNGGNGGWNEVAKKGGNTAPKEDTSNIAGFRMVASKKGKGKKQA
jgi:PERQ amino acid-rich with GYF domain-containing protein